MIGRDTTLASRNENTRSIQTPVEIKIFDIEEIARHFRENIQSVESKFGLSSTLIEIGKHKEADDIFRSQIMFLESAFDFYMHEIVKLGITCIFKSNWNADSKTEKYKNLMIEMQYVERALYTNDDSWLSDWITKKYASITLMSYDAFKAICNLLELNIKNIADNSFYEEGGRESTKIKLKKFLNDLYNRRNYIAHQSDRRMADAEIQNILEEDTRYYIDKIKVIIESIGTEIREKIITFN